MKFKIYKSSILAAVKAFLIYCLLISGGNLIAQDNTVATNDAPVAKKIKPVKNTFQSVWIIDNQTILVPVKGTFEMDIQHRFGTINKGYQDFWGFFAPSNIRLGFSYVPFNKLNIGLGVTKTTAVAANQSTPSPVSGPFWDGSLKYSIITQTKGRYPVSVTYYTNVGFNTKKDPDHAIYRDSKNSLLKIHLSSDRLSYFHQLIIARKINDKISVQVAPSVSHQNVVNGYFVKLNDTTLEIKPEMNSTHFAIAFAARYKLSNVTSLMLGYDQPITKHTLNNPNPNLSFGLEFNTSSHSFQLFFTNFFYLNPQVNNLYNHNSPFINTQQYLTKNPIPGQDPVLNNRKVEGGKFLIGFNITRLWNY